MISEDCLAVLQPAAFESSVENYTIHTYKPFNSSNLSWNDEIRIPVQNKNLVCLPHLSYLYIAGKVENGGNFNFDFNGLAHLFTSISYELNGFTIDHTSNIGITSTMKAYLSLSALEANYLESTGFTHTDTYGVYFDPTRNEIHVYIPLKYLLGLFEDYTKVFVNCTHELVLTRAKDDSNVFYTTHADANNIPQLIISEISWKLPQLTLSDSARIHFLNIIKQNKELFLPFRTWDFYEFPSAPQSTSISWSIKTVNSLLKPRYVIVTFQTKRKNNLKAQISHYDNVGIESFQLFLNETRYPYELPQIDFSKNRYSLLYENFCNFYSNYYKQPFQAPQFNMSTFVSTIPMIVIDCSHQRDTFNITTPNSGIASGPLNIRLDLRFKENLPEGTNINCMILYDRMFSYRAMDGIVKQIL